VSATAIWIMVIVIVVALAAFLLLIRYAAEHPGHKTRRREQLRGMVQGGQHVGAGRSVMPHRDAPVPEGGTAPGTDMPDVEDREADAGQGTGRAGSGQGQRPRNSGNPMDL
jgi:hypothetical protein